MFEYKGPREKNGIIDYMKEQAKSPSWEIQSAIEAKNNIARTEATAFGFFTEKNDMYEEYIGAANELRGILLSKKSYTLKFWCCFHTIGLSIIIRC